ncbi:MAG TPA: methyl-accepting chemotaxis protein [Ktedonobacteraceae bacterium]|jgi:methyl-accepting chemotaxis protein
MNRSSQPPPDASTSDQKDGLAQSKTPNPHRGQYNPLLKLSIAHRLVLGFLVPALLVALAAGTMVYQSTQLLNNESNFYQNLFNGYAQLTSGGSTLQQMESKLEDTFNDARDPGEHNALSGDQATIQGFANSYSHTLTQYEQNDLLDQHPNEVALFAQSGHAAAPTQQRTLANQVPTAWQTYQALQGQILHNILTGQVEQAQNLLQTQGEPAFDHALGALNALVQFDRNLVVSVQGATTAHQTNLLITTLIAAACILLAIGIIGWLVWRSVVPRLRQLQQLAFAVQAGHMETRAKVTGHDEITDVSISANRMLDTIVDLLQESRHQSELIMKASERLFIEMRIARSTSPEALAAMRSDPVGSLVNAFHFTIGRFRRYLQQNHAMLERLEMAAQQEMSQVEAFHRHIRTLLYRVEKAPPRSTPLASNSSEAMRPDTSIQEIGHLVDEFSQQITSLAQRLCALTRDMREIYTHFQQSEPKSEQAFLAQNDYSSP